MWARPAGRVTDAAEEGLVSDLGEAVGKVDLGQPVAAVEGLKFDLGEAGGKVDPGQPLAAPEGPRSDVGEAGREDDLGQPTAAGEGLLSDLDGAGWDFHLVLRPLLPRRIRELVLVGGNVDRDRGGGAVQLLRRRAPGGWVGARLAGGTIGHRG